MPPRGGIRGEFGAGMHFGRVAVVALLAGVSPALFEAGAARAEPRAVVELFTSQGCSSCPPADALLGELARDPSIVAMSLPVDYWDYLGWKDTLALPGHTKRQRAYARARGDREVYTPQVVVNGVVHALGSDKAKIERAIAQTRGKASPLALPVNVALAGDKIAVTVAESKNERGDAEVWLCALTSAAPVAIGRGENHGRTVTYYNVARRWLKLGEWTGKAATFSVPVSEVRALGNIDAVAVIVQDGSAGSPGLMLGAATASLR
jgi:hypothetical protein